MENVINMVKTNEIIINGTGKEELREYDFKEQPKVAEPPAIDTQKLINAMKELGKDIEVKKAAVVDE